MKLITPIILAGITLALCGCETDSPIFATEASKPADNTAGPTNAEQARDIYNANNSGTSMGQQFTPAANPTSAMQAQENNPYAH